MAINYTPGQILYIKSAMGPWYYISVLRCARPVKRSTPIKRMEDEIYELRLSWISYRELHTCCDLCIEKDGSECLTFARGNGSFLDLDTSFIEVRAATCDEREYLYNAMVKAFKNYDLGWANHFTDSSYDDIRDWLCLEFDVDLDNMDNDNPLVDTVYDITNYIWDALCKETGNYQACTDYVEPEMVNKQEFIAKAKAWVKNCFIGPFGEGMADNIADEFEKYLKE